MTLGYLVMHFAAGSLMLLVLVLLAVFVSSVVDVVKRMKRK